MSHERTGDGDEVRLLVLPSERPVEEKAAISGLLEVNDQGCVTVGGDVLVAEAGASVAAGADQVELPGVGAVPLGRSVSGAGGYLTTATQIDHVLRDRGLADAARDCGGYDDGVVLLHLG